MSATTTISLTNAGWTLLYTASGDDDFATIFKETKGKIVGHVGTGTPNGSSHYFEIPFDEHGMASVDFLKSGDKLYGKAAGTALSVTVVG